MFIKVDVSNTSYYIEVENGVMENDPLSSWKSHGNFLWKKCGNPELVMLWISCCEGKGR